MDKEELRKFVNKIFAKKGYPPVKKFASEFADGILFQQLFNLMYDEKIDCRLKPSALVDDRLLNWNRINSIICFNYLQQRFYLVKPTMTSLAKGTNSDTIFKLIKVMINTQQEDYKIAIQGDTGDIQDVCSQIETDRALFGQKESNVGTSYNQGFDSPDEDEAVDEERAQLSPQPFFDVEKDLPTKNLILGGAGNETVDQINTGKLNVPDRDGVKDLKQQTGWRSAQFNFLLDNELEQPNRKNSPYLKRQQQKDGGVVRQDTYNKYINDLAGGDKAVADSNEHRMVEVRQQLAEEEAAHFDSQEANVPEVSIRKQPSASKKDRSPRKSRKAKKAAKTMTDEDKEKVKTQLAADLAHQQQLEATIAEKIKNTSVSKLVNPKNGDFQELKALSKPPQMVKDVFSMLMVLLYGSDSQEASWMDCKKVMANPNQLITTIKQVSSFDISGKDPYLIQLLIQMQRSLNTTVDAVAKKSVAAGTLYNWINSIVERESIALDDKITLLEVKARIEEHQTLMDAIQDGQ